MPVIAFKEGCHFTIDNIPFGVFSVGVEGKVIDRCSQKGKVFKAIFKRN